MITNVKNLLGEQDVNLGKWIKVSPEEEKAVLESLAGENLMRANQGKPGSLRHYSDRGHIVVTLGECEAHPLDAKKADAPKADAAK